jgi:hypothetical protein
MSTRKRSDGFVRKVEISGKSVFVPDCSPGLTGMSPQPENAATRTVIADIVRVNLHGLLLAELGV